MKMKKTIAMLLAFVLCLSLCACGSSETPQAQPEPDTSNAELEIESEEGYNISMLFSQCSPDLVVHGKAGSTIAKQCAQEDTFFTVIK